MIGLQLLFWLSCALIVYTYVGYPLLIYLAARLFERPIKRSNDLPTCTLVIAAYNEERIIVDKLENSLALDYPADRLRILVVTDGSTDSTPDLVAGYSQQGVRLAHRPQREGKTAAINRAMSMVDTEIAVISDANAMLNEDALQLLVRQFGDPDVGGVAGEKRVRGAGEGWYWRYESLLKRCESSIHSVMGAAGELFAFRTALFTPLPQDALTDDFVLSLRLVLAGWRVSYEPEATATEDDTPELADQWERRARNTAGAMQALKHIGGMLSPTRPVLAWQFFSHKILRFGITPFLMPAAWLLNLALVGSSAYLGLFLAQTVFYLLALAGYAQARSGKRGGLLHAVFYFCLANGAAIAGAWRALTRSQPVLWDKAR